MSVDATISLITSSFCLDLEVDAGECFWFEFQATNTSHGLIIYHLVITIMHVDPLKDAPFAVHARGVVSSKRVRDEIQISDW